MKAICDDLKAEYEELDAIVSELSDSGWDKVTPFYNWTIRDEISHIAWADSISLLAATDERKFKEHAKDAMKDIDEFFDIAKRIGQGKKPSQILEWWRSERNGLISTLKQSHPKTKLPWYGPSMNAMSFATARIMETWAHGQDIVDTLGINRQNTGRLRHIAHLGYRTMSFAYLIRGREAPEVPIRVELESPQAEIWSWGPEDAKDIVRGTAEDFCLAVTRRRHINDVSLEINGSTANEWMTICQVFAGPPDDGAKAGRFKK